MKRVLVIGPCGAGKSTLARALAEKVALPLHHMDQLNWKPGWIESSDAELRAKLRAIVGGTRWLIEGTYGGTLDERLPRADTVVYLDFPIRLCLWRLIRRILTYRGRTRPDMSEGCPERLDLAFLWYAACWARGPRRRLEAQISGLDVNVIRLRTPRMAACWLEAVRPARALGG